MLGRSNHNLNVTAQSVQEPKQPVRREPIELAPQECRHLRLVDSQELRRPGLRELPLGDDIGDTLYEFGFGEQLFRVLEPRSANTFPLEGSMGTGLSPFLYCSSFLIVFFCSL